jgi:uncharacterized short protein YbdD (DUF466 family)
MRKPIRDAFTQLAHAFRLMIGIPDYEKYVEHRRRHHPTQPIMSYKEFFRDRQRKRYEGGAGKCC